jgi:hypothetical protein
MKTAVRRATTKSGTYRRLLHWCEACGHVHGVRIDDGPLTESPKWTWDGDREKPTLSPSVLNFTTDPDTGARETLCHYHLKAGIIEYCADNPHALNGKSVPLVDIPASYGLGGSDDG